MAKGNVSIGAAGIIQANGGNGQNTLPAGMDNPGAGGGGGGVIIIAGETVTVAGALRANGGNGAHGANGNTGNSQGAGAGGGGGGGIVHLIASTTPVVTGTVQATGGAAGADEFAGVVSLAGGGGGAGAGSGGGGGVVSASLTQAAQNGASGYVFTTVVPTPANVFLP